MAWRMQLSGFVTMMVMTAPGLASGTCNPVSPPLHPDDASGALSLLANTNIERTPEIQKVYNWTALESPCCWAGIKCAVRNESTRIVGLNVSSINGIVEEPVEIIELADICVLSALETIDISGVAEVLSDGLFSPCFKDFRWLTHLDMTSMISGSFGASIWDVASSMPPQLESLSVAGQEVLRGFISDSTPVDWPPALHTLSIGGTAVSIELGSWFLERNWVSFSAFGAPTTGRIPETVPSTLEWFVIGSEAAFQLGSTTVPYGELTESWCEATNLTVLSITNTALGGAIPSCFGNLRKLAFLDLSSTSVAGPLPASFSQLVELTTIRLSNNIITDLSALWVLLPLVRHKLRDLQFDRNPLGQMDLAPVTYTASRSGAIVVATGVLPDPNKVDSVYAPPVLFDLPVVETLSIANSALNAKFPSDAFVKMPSLRFLDIRNNHIYGTVSDFSMLENITAIKMFGNKKLRGPDQACEVEFGSDWVGVREGTFRSPYFEWLDLGRMALCGPAPSQLLSLALREQLTQISFAENAFAGKLELQGLDDVAELAIQTLDLSSLGLVTGSLSALQDKVPNLQSLSTSFSAFSGVSPGRPIALEAESTGMLVDLASVCVRTDVTQRRKIVIRDTLVRSTFPASCLLENAFEQVTLMPSVSVVREYGAQLGQSLSASSSSGEREVGPLGQVQASNYGSDSGTAGERKSLVKPRFLIDTRFVELVRAYCPAPATECQLPPSQVFNPDYEGTRFLSVLRLGNMDIIEEQPGYMQVFMDSLCLFTAIQTIDIAELGLEASFPPCLSKRSSLVQLSMPKNPVKELSPAWSDSLVPAAFALGLFTDTIRPDTRDADKVAFRSLSSLILAGTSVAGTPTNVLRLLNWLPSLATIDLSKSAIAGELDMSFAFSRVQERPRKLTAEEMERMANAQISARIGGVNGVGPTLEARLAASSVLPGAFAPRSAGFPSLTTLNLAFTRSNGSLPLLPIGLNSFNASYTFFTGSIPFSYVYLLQLDLSGCVQLRGESQVVPSNDTDAPTGGEAVVLGQPLLPPFVVPDGVFAERIKAGDGYDGEAECQGVKSDVNKLLRAVIPQEYDDFARCRCRIGSYGSKRACSKCPQGSTTLLPGAGSLALCTCPAGFELRPDSSGNSSSLRCTSCAPGFYRSKSDGPMCVTCPSNATSFPGTQRKSNCQCLAGTQPVGANAKGSVLKDACEPCSPMTFKPDAGNSRCQSCPAGKFALESGSSACQSCAAEGVLCDAPSVTFEQGFWAPASALLEPPLCYPNATSASNASSLCLRQSPAGPLFACPNRFACSVDSTSSAHSCAEGFTGASCTACGEQHTSIGWAQCRKCSSVAGEFALLVAVVIGAMIIAASVECCNDLLAGSSIRVAALAILLDFVLVASRITNLLVAMPEQLSYLVSVVTDAPQVIGLLGSPFACMFGLDSPLVRQLANLFLPWLGVVLFAWVLAPVGVMAWRGLTGTCKAEAKKLGAQIEALSPEEVEALAAQTEEYERALREGRAVAAATRRERWEVTQRAAMVRRQRHRPWYGGDLCCCCCYHRDYTRMQQLEDVALGNSLARWFVAEEEGYPDAPGTAIAMIANPAPGAAMRAAAAVSASAGGQAASPRGRPPSPLSTLASPPPHASLRQSSSFGNGADSARRSHSPEAGPGPSAVGFGGGRTASPADAYGTGSGVELVSRSPGGLPGPSPVGHDGWAASMAERRSRVAVLRGGAPVEGPPERAVAIDYLMPRASTVGRYRSCCFVERVIRQRVRLLCLNGCIPAARRCNSLNIVRWCRRECPSVCCCTDESIWLCSRPALRRSTIGISIAASLIAFSTTGFWGASLLKCVELNGRVRVLEAEPSLACGSAEASVLNSVAWATIICIGTSFPVILAGALALLEQDLNSEAVRRTLGFVYAGFRRPGDDAAATPSPVKGPSADAAAGAAAAGAAADAAGGHAVVRDEVAGPDEDPGEALVPGDELAAGAVCTCGLQCTGCGWEVHWASQRTGPCNNVLWLRNDVPFGPRVNCRALCWSEDLCGVNGDRFLFLWRPVMVLLRHIVITMCLAERDSNWQSGSLLLVLLVSLVIQFAVAPYRYHGLNILAVMFLSVQFVLVIASTPDSQTLLPKASTSVLGAWLVGRAPDMRSIPFNQLVAGVILLGSVAALLLYMAFNCGYDSKEAREEEEKLNEYRRRFRVIERGNQADAEARLQEEAQGG